MFLIQVRHRNRGSTSGISLYWWKFPVVQHVVHILLLYYHKPSYLRLGHKLSSILPNCLMKSILMIDIYTDAAKNIQVNFLSRQKFRDKSWLQYILITEPFAVSTRLSNWRWPGVKVDHESVLLGTSSWGIATSLPTAVICFPKTIGCWCCLGIHDGVKNRRASCILNQQYHGNGEVDITSSVLLASNIYFEFRWKRAGEHVRWPMPGMSSACLHDISQWYNPRLRDKRFSQQFYKEHESIVITSVPYMFNQERLVHITLYQVDFRWTWENQWCFFKNVENACFNV